VSVFGFEERELASLVRSVRPERPGADAPDGSLADEFAALVWTSIAEPGDRVCGALTRALGPGLALRLLIERVEPERIAAEVEAREATGEPRPALVAALRDALDRWQPRISARLAVRAIEQAARFRVGAILPQDPDWPRGLDDLGESAPAALWFRGDVERFRWFARSVAVVGARASTGYGDHVAAELTAGLGDRGVAIVSGGAYGIDGVAHRTALASDARTVAILAGGLDRFYPSGHDALLTRVAADGLVIAEVPCGTSPTRWRFLQRNRVLAAATIATIVVEAGARSGSLNTAGHAAQLGRRLGAVPGPVTSAASAGCHRLLREFDADCITSVDDALELAGLDVTEPGSAVDPAPRTDPPDVVRVLDALSPRQPMDAMSVAAAAGMSLGDVLAVLGPLELEGRARESERGWLRSTTVAT